MLKVRMSFPVDTSFAKVRRLGNGCQRSIVKYGKSARNSSSYSTMSRILNLRFKKDISTCSSPARRNERRGAALQITCDLVDEGLISEQVGLQRLPDYDLDALELVRLECRPEIRPIASGVPACPGVAVGQIVFDPQAALAMARRGRHPILVRQDIATDDVAAMAQSNGILTMLGGRTSHAAVVARQLNKVCIVGCQDLIIEANRRCRIGSTTLSEGDFVSLDGHSGEIYCGQLEIVKTRPTELLEVVQRWRHSTTQRSQLAT
jgi:phosphohistidine swiveling domain-containing protein